MDPYSKSSRTWWNSKVTTHETSSNVNGPYDLTFDSFDSGFGVNSFSGGKNPNWKQQVRQGINATTGASGQRYKVLSHEPFSAGNSSRTVLNPGQTNESSWDQTSETYGRVGLSFPAIPSIPGDVATAATNRAIRKFLDKCDSVRSSFEAGQDFGETKETLHSILNPLESLRTHVLSYFPSLKKARKGRHSTSSLRKALAATYLEWTFGWKPLALDIADAVVGLQNRKNHVDTVPVEASATEHYDGSVGFWGYPGGGLFNLTGSISSSSKYTVRFKGSMRTGAVSGAIDTSQVLQLDLPHFLPTAWDLLPYSFIVDYFINVGDIIRAISFRFSDLAWSCRTIRAVNSSRFQLLGLTPTTPDYETFFTKFTNKGGFCHGGNAELETTTFNRSIIDSTDLVPKVQFSLPHSPKPYENIAALLIAGSLPFRPFF